MNQGDNMQNPINQTHPGNGDNVAGNVEHNTFNAPVGVGINKGTIQDDVKFAVVNNEASQQNLTEAAKEIQALLEQLSQTYPSNTSKEKNIVVGEVVDQIENNPTLKGKVINALKSGGVEAFKEAINHPLVNILVATIDGWQNAD